MVSRKTCEPPAIGERFGKWTVISECFYTPDGRYRMVRVRCECGAERTVSPWHLHNNKTSMCKRCLGDENAKIWRTHGERDSHLYMVWAGMRGRCAVTSNVAYSGYGGRGIRVCDEWQDYLVFKAWALENGFAEDLQIDRRDNDGDYTPENCRWVTRTVNCRNRRTSHFVEAWGESKTTVAWAEDPRCKVPYTTFLVRMRRDGLSPEEAMTKPLRKWPSQMKG